MNEKKKQIWNSRINQMRGDTKNKLNGSTQIYRGKNLKGKKNITYTENLIALLISMAIYSI